MARAALRSAEQRVGVIHHQLAPIEEPQPAGGLGVLLPAGLPQGAACEITGSTTVLLAVLAAAQGDHRWVAFVGMPALGAVAAAEAGIDLGRVAHIPNVRGRGVDVVAALLDGVDLVVIGPGCALTATDRRRLLARARERGTTLIATTPWEGAALVLDVQRVRWAGPERGDFWLRTATWDIIRHTKADGPGRRFTITTDHDGALRVHGAARPGLRLVGVA